MKNQGAIFIVATITGVYHAGYQKFYDKTDVGFVAKKISANLTRRNCLKHLKNGTRTVASLAESRKK